MGLRRFFLIVLLILLYGSWAFSQNAPESSSAPAFPYLLHLETVTFDDDACVLLKRDGWFHLEEQNWRGTRVFEGTIPQPELAEVREMLDSEELRKITPQQIENPSLVILDELHIDIFRGNGWQQILFPDSSSRRPFEHAIASLLRWFEALHKEPHRRLSEDEGMNNCQIPKKPLLKRRGAALNGSSGSP